MRDSIFRPYNGESVPGRNREERLSRFLRRTLIIPYYIFVAVYVIGIVLFSILPIQQTEFEGFAVAAGILACMALLAFSVYSFIISLFLLYNLWENFPLYTEKLPRTLVRSFLFVCGWYVSHMLVGILVGIASGTNPAEAWVAGMFGYPEECVPLSPLATVAVSFFNLYGLFELACLHWGVYAIWFGLLFLMQKSAEREKLAFYAEKSRGKRAFRLIKWLFCMAVWGILVGAFMLLLFPSFFFSLIAAFSAFDLVQSLPPWLPPVVLFLGVSVCVGVFFLLRKNALRASALPDGGGQGGNSDA